MQDVESLIHQIAAMDYVITIDNTVAFIAGALGIKTYLLLNPNGNWPWEVKKANPSFFPSIEIVKQMQGESWQEVVKRLIVIINKSKKKRFGALLKSAIYIKKVS